MLNWFKPFWGLSEVAFPQPEWLLDDSFLVSSQRKRKKSLLTWNVLHTLLNFSFFKKKFNENFSAHLCYILCYQLSTISPPWASTHVSPVLSIPPSLWLHPPLLNFSKYNCLGHEGSIQLILSCELFFIFCIRSSQDNVFNTFCNEGNIPLEEKSIWKMHR